MKFFSRKITVIGVLVAAIVIVVLFTARNQRAAVNEFFTTPVDRGPLRNVVNATGVLQNVVTVQVGSQVSGLVQEIYADYNSVVKRGQLLAKLDPRNFDAQVENSDATVASAQARVRGAEADIETNNANLASAKANLEAAKVTRDTNFIFYERAEGSLAKGIVSKNDYDTAKYNYDSADAKYLQAKAAVDQGNAQGLSLTAALEAAQAQLKQASAGLEQAKLNLEYSHIYSPVDGVVISRSIDVGQTIAASLQAPTLFSIANDLSQMQVNASVDEADIGNISAAEDVKFTVDAYPNDVFKAKISEIRLSPQTVQNVVTYSVILNIDNSDMKLRPGMTATITFTVDQRDSVLKIPNAALRYTPPGQTRPDPKEMAREANNVEKSDTPGKVNSSTAAVDTVTTRLAPGQMWNPADKIRFVTPKKHVQRPALIWVLNAQKQPEKRNIVLGITDGVNSEISSGDMKVGDQVIIGDSGQAGTNGQQQRGFFSFGPPPGGGGGGNRGGGRGQ